MTLSIKIASEFNLYGKPESVRRSITTILIFFFPLPVAWLSLSLTSAYMEYYDIGVNSGANNGFLFFFVGPALLIGLFITAAATRYLANRLLKSRLLVSLLCMTMVLVVAISAFLIQVRAVADYPTDKERDITRFLKYYVNEIMP